jgi:hypothetical protein
LDYFDAVNGVRLLVSQLKGCEMLGLGMNWLLVRPFLDIRPRKLSIGGSGKFVEGPAIFAKGSALKLKPEGLF